MPPNKGEGFWGGGNIVGPLGTPIEYTNGQQPVTLLAVIAQRTNTVLQAREIQLATNILGLEGGRPYVAARLSRFPGENKIEWEGGQRSDGSTVTGRKDRAPCVQHLARIAHKLNEWLFSTAPTRTGGDDTVKADITNTGDSVDDVMKDANDFLTAAGWCWIGLNAPPNDGSEKTLRQIREQRLRAYWQLYSPLDVRDWELDPLTGETVWALTESTNIQNSNPRRSAVKTKHRFLWERSPGPGKPAQVTRFDYAPHDDKTIASATAYPLLGLNKCPMILIGKPSAKPHPFDGLESINKSILDLESCNDENYYKAMFPQRFIPAAAVDAVTERFHVDADEAVSMLFGLGYPILLGADDPAPGFMMPDASAMGKIRDEIRERKREMFESVGLMISKETKQVESAEAKAWDHQDVAMFLSERAARIEAGERKCVALTAEWDKNFQPWETNYNRDFDIPDFKSEMEAIVIGEQVSQPIEMTRLRLRRMQQLLAKRLSGGLSNDEATALDKAIKNWTGPQLSPILEPEIQIDSD